MNDSTPLNVQATLCDQWADELEAAMRHARTMAEHFRNGEVPRAGAHFLSTQGHLVNALQFADQIATRHAANSKPSPTTATKR